MAIYWALVSKPRRWKIVKNSKQGTTIVEAAIIFPLVIAAVFTVIYIMISLYSHTTLQSSLHIALRGAEGLETGLTVRTLEDGTKRNKYRAANESKPIDVGVSHHIIHPYVFAETQKTYGGAPIFNTFVDRQYAGRYYLVNDTGIIRNIDLAKNLLSGLDP